MVLLLRIVLAFALIAGLVYGAMLALGTFVTPQSREIVQEVPMPKAK